MHLVLIMLAVMAAAAARAEEPQETSKYRQVFTLAGKEINATEAILASIRGEEVFKCQTVEFKVSKSGTSIGIKNVKKPKSN